MHGPTFPFAPTKTYGPIFVNLRDKFFSLYPSLLSFSLSLTFSPSLRFVPKKCHFPFFFFYFSYFIFFSFLFYFYYYYFFLFPFFCFIFVFLSFPLFPPLDSWLNVSHSHKCTTYHAMCHLTPDASKNVKFQLSRNPMKFNKLTRFREKNSTVKSIRSSKI